MSVDPAEDGWVTTAEAGGILGLSKARVLDMCRQGQLAAHKIETGDGPSWRIDPDAVERERGRRELEAGLKAAGFRFCRRCGQWQPAEKWWKGQGYCRPCQQAERKSLRPKRSWEPSAARLSGPVEEYIATGEPSDGTEYACQDFGFHAKPLPMRDGERVSKREAYCQVCTARYCLHYKDQRITPQELVRRWKVSRGRIAAGM